MVITDPPYNISVKNNFATMGRTGIDFGDWDKGFDLLSWIDIASQKLTKNGGMIIFNDWKNLGDIARHCEKNGLVVKDIFRWVKDNPMPRNRDRRYITDSEYGVWVVRKNPSGYLIVNLKNTIGQNTDIQLWQEQKKHSIRHKSQ